MGKTIWEVAVGMPATIHCGSDAYKGEVVEIVPFATEAARKRNGRTTKAVVVKYISSGGLDGRTLTFSVDKRGDLVVPGASVYGLTLGEAYAYQDPHF
jgi:hypothetical protein